MNKANARRYLRCIRRPNEGKSNSQCSNLHPMDLSGRKYATGRSDNRQDFINKCNQPGIQPSALAWNEIGKRRIILSCGEKEHVGAHPVQVVPSISVDFKYLIIKRSKT